MKKPDRIALQIMLQYRRRINRLEDQTSRDLAREFAHLRRSVKQEMQVLKANKVPYMAPYVYATQVEPTVTRKISRWSVGADRTMAQLATETARLGAEATDRAARAVTPVRSQTWTKVKTAGLLSGGLFAAGREAVRKVPGDLASRLRDLVGQAAGMAEQGFDWLMSKVGEVFGQAWNTLSRVVRTVAEQMFRRAQQEQRQQTPVQAWRRCANHETACFACLMLEGTIYDRREDFGDHPNGRCFLMPMSSADAQNDHAGRTWLENQDEETQRRIMGKTRWEAWQNGEVTLDEMVDTVYDPDFGPIPHTVTLKELGLR